MCGGGGGGGGGRLGADFENVVSLYPPLPSEFADVVNFWYKGELFDLILSAWNISYLPRNSTGQL